MESNREIKSLVSKLMRFCSIRERCNQEIREKIKIHNLSEDEMELILNRLTSLDFLNEERFASEFVYSKHQIKGWGKIKIRAYLHQKGLPSFIIDKSLDSINLNSYKERLIDLCQKKMELGHSLDKKNLEAKIVRFLQSKGYELNLIMEVVNGLT